MPPSKRARSATRTPAAIDTTSWPSRRDASAAATSGRVAASPPARSGHAAAPARYPYGSPRRSVRPVAPRVGIDFHHLDIAGSAPLAISPPMMAAAILPPPMKLIFMHALSSSPKRVRFRRGRWSRLPNIAASRSADMPIDRVFESVAARAQRLKCLAHLAECGAPGWHPRRRAGIAIRPRNWQTRQRSHGVGQGPAVPQPSRRPLGGFAADVDLDAYPAEAAARRALGGQPLRDLSRSTLCTQLKASADRARLVALDRPDEVPHQRQVAQGGLLFQGFLQVIFRPNSRWPQAASSRTRPRRRSC